MTPNDDELYLPVKVSLIEMVLCSQLLSPSHKDKDSDYGVIVPDLPGCFPAGESIEDALENAKEAILWHIEGLLNGITPCFCTAFSGRNLSHMSLGSIRGQDFGLTFFDSCVLYTNEEFRNHPDFEKGWMGTSQCERQPLSIQTS